MAANSDRRVIIREKWRVVLRRDWEGERGGNPFFLCTISIAASLTMNVSHGDAFSLPRQRVEVGLGATDNPGGKRGNGRIIERWWGGRCHQGDLYLPPTTWSRKGASVARLYASKVKKGDSETALCVKSSVKRPPEDATDGRKPP